MLAFMAQGRVWIACVTIGGSLFSGCNSPAVNPGPTQPPPTQQGPVFPPGMTSLPEVPANEALRLDSTAGTSEYHEVKPGETLTSIAKQYGLSPEELTQANGLGDPNRLQPGQMISIPRRVGASQ